MPAAPFGLAIDPVAGDARLVAYDCAALAYDSIKESGLANVRAANDGNCGLELAEIAVVQRHAGRQRQKLN